MKLNSIAATGVALSQSIESSPWVGEINVERLFFGILFIVVGVLWMRDKKKLKEVQEYYEQVMESEFYVGVKDDLEFYHSCESSIAIPIKMFPDEETVIKGDTIYE